MFDVKDFMERTLIQQRNMLKICEKRLKDLPEGTLSMYEKNGKRYYNKYENGITKYLGNEKTEEVQALKMQGIICEMSKRIRSNDGLIRDFLKKYQEPSSELVRKSLGKAYQNEHLDLFSPTQQKEDGEWIKQPYRRNNLHPEQLTQKTLRGDFVRSKSEMIIANTYFSKGLLYRYEEIIEVGNKTLAPDFSILVPRLDKVKYHEHFGMMHNSEYRANAMRKIDMYIVNGFRPYEDIIFTFDDLDGNFDAQTLDLLITNFLM